MQQASIARLLRDWREVRSNPLLTVSAEPEERNIYVWHANIIPDTGPYAGAPFHLLIKFPPNYPSAPPKIELMCENLSHPNVFNWGGAPFICLDMLRESDSSGISYSAWSSAYSVQSILIQLQSFLFGENVEQDYLHKKEFRRVVASRESVERTLHAVRAFRCSGCGHRGDKPVPACVGCTGAVFSPYDFPPMVQTDCEDVVGANLLCRLEDELIVAIADRLAPPRLKIFEETCREIRDVCGRHHVWRRRELICFHTKKGFEEDILGFGICIKRHNDNKIKSISSPLDLMCYSAWKHQGLRHSVWRESIDLWLPVMLNTHHSKRAIPLLKSIVFGAATNMQLTSSTSMTRYVDSVLKILPKLMNTMVVELMQSSNGCGGQVKRHISNRAVEGYLSVHHMLLKLTDESKGAIANEAERRIQQMMSDDKYRHKKCIPDIGDFLCLLTLSNTHWNTISTTVMNEVFTRQICWVARDFPDILRTDLSTERRLQLTLSSQKTSLRLVMFQVAFLNLIGRPSGISCQQIIKMYDCGMGTSHPRLRRELHAKCKSIYDVRTWSEFFAAVDIQAPSDEFLANLLEKSVVNSRIKGYHRDSGLARNGKERVLAEKAA